MEDETKLHSRIRDYYEATFEDYFSGWMGRETLGMHFGFESDEVRGHSESLVNMNAVLALRGNI